MSERAAMSLNCPLCGSEHVVIKEKLSVAELTSAYEKSFGIQDALRSSTLIYLTCLECGLGFFDPLEAGGEGLYARLQLFDWYYMEDKYEYAIAKKYLPSLGTVLEVGSGKAAFAEVVGADRYTGLEFNERAIERAAKAGIRLFKQSVEAHADLGNVYDAVVSFQVLEHVADPAGFIRGCLACLKPGGVLIIAVPAHDSFVGVALNNILDAPPHHVTHWSGATLQYLAGLFGLEVAAVEYEPVSDYHRDWARKTIWESRFRRWLGMQNKLLDYSVMAKFVSKFSSILGRLLPAQLGDVKGHTVVGVYRKI